MNDFKVTSQAKSTLPFKYMIAEYHYEPQGRQELELNIGDKIEVEFFVFLIGVFLQFLV